MVHKNFVKKKKEEKINSIKCNSYIKEEKLSVKSSLMFINDINDSCRSSFQNRTRQEIKQTKSLSSEVTGR